MNKTEGKLIKAGSNSRINNGTRVTFILAIIFSVLESVCTAFYPYLLKYVVDNWEQITIYTIIIIVILFFISIALLLLFLYLKKNMIAKYKKIICYNIRKETFKEIINQNYKEFYKESFDYYVSFFVNDIELIYTKHYDNFVYLVLTGINWIVYVTMLVFVSYLMAIITAIIGVILIFIPKLIGKKFDKKQDNYSNSRANYLLRTNEILDVYDLIDKENVTSLLNIYNKALNNLQNSEYKLNKYYSFVGTISSSSLFIELFLVFSIGVIFVYTKLITIGDLSSSLVFENYIAVSIAGFASTALEIKSVNSNEEKMFQFLSKNVDKHDKNQNFSKEEFESLKIKNICYKISKKFLLNNVSLELYKGDKILVTGKNGSGKSTFGKILSDLINDYNGDILINDKNLDRFKYISYMPQRRFVYEGTVLENITFFKEKISDGEISAIKNMLDILDFKYSLSFKVQRNGTNLSGGEIAKICFVREIYRSKDILIIDEPFNELDEKTIKELTIFLNNINKTVILISHIKLGENLIKFTNEYLMKAVELKLLK